MTNTTIVVVLFLFLLFSNSITTSSCLGQIERICWTKRVESEDGKKSTCPDDCRPYIGRRKDPADTYCKLRGNKKPRCKCPWPRNGCKESEPACRWRGSGNKKKFKCKCRKPLECDPATEIKKCVEVFEGLFLECVCEKTASEFPSDVPPEESSSVPSDVPSDEPSSVSSDMPSHMSSDEPSSVPSDIPSDVPSDESSSVPSAAPSKGAPRASVMMHVVPWFNLWRPGFSSWFKDSHWSMHLDERDGLYLAGRYKRLGRVASHYTPLIGPYDSSDPATIRLQLTLMEQAGVDGIILDWYGTTKIYDSEANRIASDAIIREASAAGMSWTICYEDRRLKEDEPEKAQDAQLLADWEYIRDEYVKKYPGVLRDEVGTGRPVFYLFGPIVVKSLPRWTNLLKTVFPAESDRPFLQGVNPSNDKFLPDGVFLWPGGQLFPNVTKVEQVTEFNKEFYDTADDREWYPVTGGAYTRFHDYYKEGNPPDAEEKDYWGVHVQDLEGDTLRECMANARDGNARVVQVITWNDWQEGTQFEPSYEEGFAQLLRLQEHLLGRSDEGAMAEAVGSYNREKADEWRHCDNVAEGDRIDCGWSGVTQEQCEDKGCCYRPHEAPFFDGEENTRPWCYHRSEVAVCNCALADIRDCEARPLDRLCCCKH